MPSRTPSLEPSLAPSESVAPTLPTMTVVFAEVSLRLLGVSDLSDVLLQTTWIEITEQWMEDSILAAAPNDVEMIDVDIKMPMLRAQPLADSVEVMEDSILVAAPEGDVDIRIPMSTPQPLTDSVVIDFGIEMVFHIRGDTEITPAALVVEPFYTPAARNGYVNRLKESESPLADVTETSPLFGDGLKLPPTET